MREFPRKTTRAQILVQRSAGQGSAAQGVSDLAGVSFLAEDVLSACHYKGEREERERGQRSCRASSCVKCILIYSYTAGAESKFSCDTQRILHRDIHRDICMLNLSRAVCCGAWAD